MYKLVITEKPSVAASIAAVLNANVRKGGIYGDGYIVSYCFGHLLQLAAPDAYGDYAKWRYEDLPIVPEIMDGIVEFTKTIVAENNAPKPEYAPLFAAAKKPTGDPLGVCPRCGLPVREGEKGFFCDSGTCGFKLWKESKFWTAKKKLLTAAIVAALLKDGRVAAKGLYSEKTGKEYDATIMLDDAGGKFVNYRMEFGKR